MTGLKRIVFALLLCPFLSRAQLAELSIKGGVVANRLLQDNMAAFVKNHLGYTGSFAVTLGFPGAVRLGFAVSAYDLKADVTARHYDYNGNILGSYTSHIKYGSPLIPIEAMLIKRFNPGRIRIDIGGTVGLCTNRTIAASNDAANMPGFQYVDKTNRWATYGTLLGLQIRMGWRSGIGFEVQPKWLKVLKSPPAFVMPVMAKYCFYIN